MKKERKDRKQATGGGAIRYILERLMRQSRKRARPAFYNSDSDGRNDEERCAEASDRDPSIKRPRKRGAATKTSGETTTAQMRKRIENWAETLPSKEKSALSLVGVISNGHPQARLTTGGRAPGDKANYHRLALAKFRAFVESEGWVVEQVFEVQQDAYEVVGRIPGGTRTDYRYKKVAVTMASRLGPEAQAFLLGSETAI